VGNKGEIRLLGGVAAVHDKLGAGDKGSFVAGQKDRTPSDLFRLSAAF
jgi:hypothetical protein